MACRRVFWMVLWWAILTVLPTDGVSGAAGNENALDVSSYARQVAELGIPTLASVREAASEAQALFDQGEYEKAVDALDRWARSANWLSNLIAQGLEPFYSASYDDRKAFPYARLDALVRYETLVNDLRRQRNHAMVLRAEALVRLGRTDEAVSVYLRALDLLDIKDWEWWTRARTGLYALLGVDS